MKPKIVHARDKKVMDQLMELFIESKYKIQSSDWNYVLLKRNYYGNYAIHIVFLIIALVLNLFRIFSIWKVQCCLDYHRDIG